jgi:hypothetical protein
MLSEIACMLIDVDIYIDRFCTLARTGTSRLRSLEIPGRITEPPSTEPCHAISHGLPDGMYTRPHHSNPNNKTSTPSSQRKPRRNDAKCSDIGTRKSMPLHHSLTLTQYPAALERCPNLLKDRRANRRKQMSHGQGFRTRAARRSILMDA